MIQYRNKKKKIGYGKIGGKKPKEIKYSSEEMNMERDSREELDAVTSTYANAAKVEIQQFKDNTDTNYFTVVTFNNKARIPTGNSIFPRVVNITKYLTANVDPDYDYKKMHLLECLHSNS